MRRIINNLNDLKTILGVTSMKFFKRNYNYSEKLFPIEIGVDDEGCLTEVTKTNVKSANYIIPITNK